MDPLIKTITKISDSDSKTNIGTQIFNNEKKFDLMKSNQPLSPLPTNCMKQMYKEDFILEDTSSDHIFERKKIFYFQTLLGEQMYLYITFQPNIAYAVIALSKFSPSPTA